MDAKHLSDGSLLLTYDSRSWSKWLFGGALIMAATAVYDLTLGTRGDDRLIGLIGGITTCALAGLVMLETTRFHADRFKRVIEWQRRWAFQRRAGTIRFADIRHVAIERPIGDHGVPSRRIVIHLHNGTMVPVTAGYRPDADDAIGGAAESLRQMIGHDVRPSSEESVRALLSSGRKLDAIKLLVEDEKLSLSDAKARVDRLLEDATART
jgi:hypothetical protein